MSGRCERCERCEHPLVKNWISIAQLGFEKMSAVYENAIRGKTNQWRVPICSKLVRIVGRPIQTFRGCLVTKGVAVQMRLTTPLTHVFVTRVYLALLCVSKMHGDRVTRGEGAGGAKCSTCEVTAATLLYTGYICWPVLHRLIFIGCYTL